MIPVIKGWCTENSVALTSLAIQVHGGGGISQDFPLARMYSWQRALRFADGPDEVHRRALGRLELARFAPQPAGR